MDAPSQSQEKAKILLVEDNAFVAALWGMHLTAAGLPYDLASSAPEAIEKLRQDPCIAYVALDQELADRTFGDTVMRVIKTDLWNLVRHEYFPVVVTVSSNDFEPQGTMRAFDKDTFTDYLSSEAGLAQIRSYLRQFEEKHRMGCFKPGASAAPAGRGAPTAEA